MALDRAAMAARLTEMLGVPLITIAGLVRAAVAAKTPLGLQAEVVLAAGMLLSDDIVLGLLEERLAHADVGAGFILDGYPRDLAQAQALDALLARLQRPVDGVVQLDVDEALLSQRLAEHAQAPHGDGVEVVRDRVRAAVVRIAPVAGHYRLLGKLMGIEQVLAERGRGAAEVLVSAGPGYVPLRWAPDRVELAIGTPGGVTLVGRGGVVRALAGHDGVHELGWSPDARVLAMSAEDGGFPGVRAISAENGALLWSYVQGRESIDELRWSPDGRWIAALGSDVLVLDAASGALHLRLWPLERSQEVDEVVWSPSSRWLLLRARSRRGALGGFRVCAVADGSTVVVGSIGDEDYVGWTDGFEALFSDGTDRLAARPTSITDRFRRSLVYTRDGAHAAAEGEEHVLWIERPTGVMRIDGHPRTITALVMTPRGDVATGCRDGGVRLVRAGGDRLQLCWQAPAGERVEGLAWADDGAWLAVKSDKCVRLLPV